MNKFLLHASISRLIANIVYPDDNIKVSQGLHLPVLLNYMVFT